MYREMVLPYHDRQIRYARERGIRSACITAANAKRWLKTG
jgi:hypothetical protein